jgi:hypothetical protein
MQDKKGIFTKQANHFKNNNTRARTIYWQCNVDFSKPCRSFDCFHDDHMIVSVRLCTLHCGITFQMVLDGHIWTSILGICPKAHSKIYCIKASIQKITSKMTSSWSIEGYKRVYKNFRMTPLKDYLWAYTLMMQITPNSFIWGPNMVPFRSPVTVIELGRYLTCLHCTYCLVLGVSCIVFA